MTDPDIDIPSVEAFAAKADAWFAANTPRDLDFMLPLTFMEVGTDAQFKFLQNWQRKVYQAGFLGAAWPKAYGGGGLTQAHQDAATEAMKRHNAPIMFNTIGLGWAGPLILDRGSEADKKRYIPGILSADDVWCQGFSEPDHGSDLGNAQLKAERDGEDYILTGSKIWTTHGHYAKYMILLARTNPDAANKYLGLSFFLIPMKIPGITTRKIRKLTGEHGFTQTFFDGARVPASTRIGAEGEGWQVAMQTLMYERNAKGGQAGGISISEIDPLTIIDLARAAKRGGAPAIKDPVVREQLVDLMIENQAYLMSAERAKLPPLNSDCPQAIPLMSKLVRTEFIKDINEFALSLQGTKAGYYAGDPSAIDGGIWQRGYLNAFAATIGGGTTEIQRNIIGEHALGLPKSK